MVIGVPKEIKEQEQRVALLPSAANQLIRHGHSVLVETNAGTGCGYADEEYAKAGAEIVDQAKEVFARADMIVKVKEPLDAEFPLLRKGQILFTYLHLAASRELTQALLKSGVTGIAYESSAIARTDERDRGADVGGDGRVLSGEVQRWQRSAAWRSAGSFTGKRRRRWRRNLGCERHANGKRSARRRNDSRY